MTPELQPGQTVDILHASGHYAVRLPSRVLEVSSKGFAVFRPVINGAPVPIGETLRLTFPRRDANWTLECPVSSTVSMRVDLLYPDPAHVWREQRREHLRVAMTMPIDYQLTFDGGFGRLRQGVLQDLSGGGCLLLLGEEVVPGALIRVHLSLEEDGVMELTGRVVRVTSAERRRDRRWHVGVEFYPIGTRDRNHLIRFVFKKHREEVVRLKQRMRGDG